MSVLCPAWLGRRVTLLLAVVTASILVPALTVASMGSALAATPLAATDRAGAGEGGSAWLWPLQPRPAIIRTFEAPLGPYGPGHRGIDLAASVGAPVRAVASGHVAFAGQVGGRPVVVVDHGRLRTTYEPVLPLLRRGAAVAAGEVVGTVVLPGSHCLPLACLHVGVRDGDTYLDPLRFFPARPVRLLPVVPHGPPPPGYLPVVPPGLML